MKDIGKDKNHTWYSRTSNHIDWKSVAPNSKLRQDLNKNDWTACFHMETNSIKNPVYLKWGRTFFVFFFNHSSTRVKVYNCFWNNGFIWGEFTMPSLKSKILDFIMSYLYTMYEHRKPLESSSLMIFTQKYMPQFSKTEHVQLLGFYITLIRFVCVIH